MPRSWYVKKAEWWKHLKWMKRYQSKRERQNAKKQTRDTDDHK